MAVQAVTDYTYSSVDSSVFRAYDIRGIVGYQLHADAYYSIGRALGWRMHELKRKATFIARDGRLTSESFACALKQGLLESGIDVVDLGAVATPVMYYATKSDKHIDCGLMVTGSHNPSNYNGLKMVLAGRTLVAADVNNLRNILENKLQVSGRGTAARRSILSDYIQRVLQGLRLERPLKVVVDCGNGIAGSYIPQVFRQLGCDVIPIFCEVDGTFPNHHPDPAVPDNLIDLQKQVQRHKADIGLAFDGDADRLGVITDEGDIVWPDRLMMYYTKSVLQQFPGRVVVYDVKCSRDLGLVIEQEGGIPKMCPTGHSIVKSVMQEDNAVLAGEMSGHIFFNDVWYGFDDALYSACRLLVQISQSKESVTRQFNTVPNRVSTPEIQLMIADDKKFQFMDMFRQNARFENAKLVLIDGVRVEFPDGWGLLRASNTTPCLVTRFEANTQDRLQEIQALFKAELAKMDTDKNLTICF